MTTPTGGRASRPILANRRRIDRVALEVNPSDARKLAVGALSDEVCSAHLDIIETQMRTGLRYRSYGAILTRLSAQADAPLDNRAVHDH